MNLKWGASSRWSFRPNSVWGSVGTTTIGKTNPTLWHINRFRDIGKMFTAAANDKRI